MTIITKSSEKKSDSLQDPLVHNIVIEQDERRKSDVEAGGYSIPPSETARYIISARVRPYYSLMFILMLVILVATSLLGIFGTQYLYEEYKYLMGAEQQPGVYRTWGTFNYGDEPYSAAYESKVPLRFERTDEPTDNEILSLLFSKAEGEANDENKQQYPNSVNEELELDLARNQYEKINLNEKGRNRIVYDFFQNYTAIIDFEGQRCYIMPLDRSVVSPPKTIYDFIMKMTNKYYSIDSDKIRRDMRVQQRIADTTTVGAFLTKECMNYPMYRLEKVIGGIVKRSTENTETYTFIDGKNVMEINIHGIAETMPTVGP